MAGYWREAPFPAPVKRPRPEFEEVPPRGASFYPRDELQHDVRYSWREPEPLSSMVDISRNGMSYGSGSDMSGLGGGMLGGGSQGLGVGGLGLDSSILKPLPGRNEYFPGQDTQGGHAVGVGHGPSDASATLFVEGLPSDCTRREASHIFRPFVGFKEVRLVRKDSKRPGGEQYVLCFVDFTDAKCASVAYDSLQGYKFDESDQNSATLRMQYARVPAPRPTGPRVGGGRDTRFGRP